MELLSKVMQAVLEAALPLLVSALTVWAIGKAREVFVRIKNEKPDVFYDLLGIARVVVNAAEQIYQGPGRGKEKKEYALGVIQSWLKSKGLMIDVNVIAAAIEAEVRSMNNVLKESPEIHHDTGL